VRVISSSVHATPPVSGAVALVGSALLFAAMALFAKAASHGIPGTQVAFVRSVFGLAVCSLVAIRRPFVGRNKWGLFWRGLTGAVAVSFYFLGIEHLPVGIATLLNYTAPVFTAWWSGLLLATRPDRRTLGALGLTTVGLCFVLRGQSAPETLSISGWHIVGLLGAIASGLSMALIGELRKTDGAWEIFAAFSLACMLVTSPIALTRWVHPSPRAWLLLAGMGVFSVSAQVLMTWAMRFVSATLAGVINQLTPVASLLVGWFLFAEHFGMITAIGICLTLCGGAFGAYLARRAGV
jgi:drug/metabolite transporter (DMT)-like permease